jgi:GT2 family glycosyltransferase
MSHEQFSSRPDVSTPAKPSHWLGLEEREYDLSSRHVHTARIVETVVGPGPILDIGGSQGLTGSVLADRRVIVVDILSAGVDVIASGDALPFADRAFAAALALDVLEHVPDPVKERIVAEAARVSDVVIFAGPYDAPMVRSAERQQRELFEELFGRRHPWLEEHAASGLPSLEETRNALADLGFDTHVFGSNPLSLWSAQLVNSHLALRVGFEEPTYELRRWLLREFFDVADGTKPSYRHFVVGARDPSDLPKLKSVEPSSLEELVSEAVRRTELSTAATLAHALTTKDAIHAEAMRGWSESVEALRNVQDVLSSEKTVQSEEAIILASGAWREQLAGPPLTTDAPNDTRPGPADYARWRSARVHPDPPDTGPLFSIITPVFNPTAEHLTACIRSVLHQTYSNWQLILVDVSDQPHVQPIENRFCELDDRISVHRLENEGIAANTNAGVSRSEGDWIVFLDHDDALEPHALAALAHRINVSPECDFIYSDEDKLSLSDTAVEPFFKPDWSPDLLQSVNYIAHLNAVTRALFDRVGGVRTDFEGAQDYDFVLRATDEARRIEHVPDVLYHWRQHEASTSLDVQKKPAAHSAGRRALQQFVTGRSPGTWVEIGAGATAHRVRYQLREELVSIVIPFRDQSKLTDACLNSLAASEPVLPMEVLLVSNRSEDSETFDAMERWDRQWDWIRVLEFDEPFNFQRLNNWAVQKAEGSLLLFLNNDTESLHRGWIETLAEHAQRPEIGAVGARLFYPDGSVQHAGVAVGIGGFAEHPWSHLHPDAVTPAGPSYWVRNVLAVTAACLMVAHEKFESIGGFDERFQICGGDVDLCLRLIEAGWLNLMNPFCRLIHHEAATRNRQPPDNDVRQSLRAYARYLTDGDPYFNPNLTRSNTSCRLATS